MKTFKDFLKEWNVGNVFYRRKSGDAVVTGSLGGGGSLPYSRVSTGGGVPGVGGSVRYSTGTNRKGKYVVYQTMTQKVGQGLFRRSRNQIKSGTPKITKIKMYKTPRMK